MSAVPPPDELLDLFWEHGLVLFGDRVREEYALRTPIFIDLRRRLHERLDALDALGRALHRKIAEMATPGRLQQAIGIPDTATPIALAAALASRGTEMPLAFGQLRKRPAAYPGGRSGACAYMGLADPAREVTLIDDVMASGRTKLWAIEQLASEGVRVDRVLVVVDREQGGDEPLRLRGVACACLYRVGEAIDYYRATGRIDDAAADAAREHVRRRRFD
jgi:uridine monophosphate synthetase